MTQSMIVACPHCHRKNRIDSAKLAESPLCGVCKSGLFTGQPLPLDASAFNAHASSDLPLVVDFWAPWCGPCRQFAPVFEKAAGALEPRARLAKVNTEDQQQLAARFGIRSIPTLLIMRSGKEIARVAGAMPAGQFTQWVNQQLGE
ncbi:thioredoxin TrxC [Halopseudomonas sp.]|uniref:thioredoxin TrxC n=1 Tax=Halopseudomonas sp. TaxID=2901191 RepID=UPI003566187F